MSNFHAVFEMRMPIRWGDMDAFGHVNNTVYFRYMEQVRISWFEHMDFLGHRAHGQGPVIVNASMEFLKQLHYPGDVIGRMSVASSPSPVSRQTKPGCESARALMWPSALRKPSMRGSSIGATSRPMLTWASW